MTAEMENGSMSLPVLEHPDRDGANQSKRVTRRTHTHALRVGLALLSSILAAVWFAAWPVSVWAAGTRPNWNPGPPWAPLKPHSPEMHMISDLFWVMLVISAIVFFGVAGAVVYSYFRFTAKPGAPEPPQIAGNRTLETLWTVIPFIILIVAFAITAKYVHDINTPPKGRNLLDVVAKGHQWWWEFDYTSLGVITADELHLPTGVPIHFHVESNDVIHSFWVPQLQRQIDANPGQDNAVYVEMDQPGTYGGMCYEYCGTGHAWMKFEVVVQPPAQFDAWVRAQQKPRAKPHGLAAQGEKLFLGNTCVDCHTINGIQAGGTYGPNLTHLGSRWAIGAGAASMTPANLMQWIHDPTSFKPGVLMPSYPRLSQKDLQALATYLYGLK